MARLRQNNDICVTAATLLASSVSFACSSSPSSEDNPNPINRTGWGSERYDALMHRANSETDVEKRAGLLREAETILIHDEVPIAPLYFYTGIYFYDADKWEGIYPNLLDEHPLNCIRRKTPATAKAN